MVCRHIDDRPVTLDYDANGNLIADGRYNYVYDAFNRLAGLKWAHGNTLRDLTFARYFYDALGRRIRKELYSTTYDHREPMFWDNNEDYYYTGQQVAELRNNSVQTERIFVFGTQYVDEPVCMGWNYYPQTDNSCFTTSDRHYIYHQDANYNVVALTDKIGRAVEHYEYDPYGQARIHRGRAGWGGDDPNGCLL